jgi:hypothetical protein
MCTSLHTYLPAPTLGPDGEEENVIFLEDKDTSSCASFRDEEVRAGKQERRKTKAKKSQMAKFSTQVRTCH